MTGTEYSVRLGKLKMKFTYAQDLALEWDSLPVNIVFRKLNSIGIFKQLNYADYFIDIEIKTTI